MPWSDHRPLTVGTAGHIDHGKTILVEALTGVNTDRLPEERSRGISIELGFAPLELPSGRLLSVIDVPGHERFVRTMVAGASGIDMFLLVVAADDGVMPQTREHLAVLSALDVPAGVVALTRADLVEAEGLELALEEARDLLAGGRYENSAVVPVCAPARRGLAELTVALDRVASDLPGRPSRETSPRLHVDRSFTLKGIGTVVTGTLWSGALSVGDEVRIEPSGRCARVRSIEVHSSARESAAAGQRVALNLAAIGRREVRRGDVICTVSSELSPTYLIDAAVELLPAARPLRQGSRIHVHHGTRESPGRVALLEGDVLEPGAREYAQVRLERPMVPASGDRFVLRQIAPPDTIGGGVVVDPAPRKHGAGRGAHAVRLSQMESADPLERLSAELAGASSGLGGTDADQSLLERLCATGRGRRVGKELPRYFSPSQLDLARGRLLAALELGTGRPMSRGALADAAGLSDLAARALLEDMVAAGDVVGRGPGFLSAAAGVLNDPRLSLLLDLLQEDGLEPAGVEALAAEVGMRADEARELLERAALEGSVVRVKPGLYYHPRAMTRARELVVSLCRRDGSVTIGALRNELGTSRKYAQALLEYLDAQRVTRRVADEHVLRGSV